MIRTLPLALASVLLAATSAFAQGRVEGRVTDAVTGEPLRGVQVLVQNTDRGTVTDLDGNYVLTGVPTGAQVIVAQYIGYAVTRLPLSVDLGTVRDANLSLHSGINLEDVVMEGGRSFPTFLLPVSAVIAGLLLMSWAERRHGGPWRRRLAAVGGGGSAGGLFGVLWFATGGSGFLDVAALLALQGVSIGIWLAVWTRPPGRHGTGRLRPPGSLPEAGSR